MRDLPHGTIGHVGGLECDQCAEIKSELVVIDDPDLGHVEMLHFEQSILATNGHFGGWVREREGGYVSVEYAKTLNRAERRKRGIRIRRKK